MLASARRFAAARAFAGGCEHPPLHGFGQSAALRLVGWLPAVVGDDACIVPGTLRQRKHPRAGSIPPLRINFMFWANRGGRVVKTNGCRFPGGRRAGCPIPPDPAAVRTSAGGYRIRPYSQRKTPRPTGKRHSHVITNLCRGRCSHCARRRVSEANRAARPGS